MTKRQRELFPELPSSRRYLADFPQLVAEFHPTKNGDLSPDDITFGSIQKIWWQCNCGHEWQRTPNGRTSRKSGCPECAKRSRSELMRRATPEYNLKTQFPDLVLEWLTAKNEKPPEYFMPGSADKVWWKCSIGHEWQATIASRTGQATGCPFCAGNKPTKERNLAFLYPRLAKEWDYSKNKISPELVSFGSDKKYWWKCVHGHEWLSSPNNRTSNESGCPECSMLVEGRNRRATEDENLLTQNPEVCAEWNYPKNEKPPEYFMQGSSDKVWWKCQNGHEWQSPIYYRTKFQSSCPFCTGHYPSESNNFEVVFPEIALDWHPTLNRKRPHEYLPKSNKRIWWKCQNGHEWKTSISNRAAGKGCPHCSGQTSKNEMRILTELMSVFENVVSRNRVDGLEIDILLPDFKIGIEYDGAYWHARKEEQDKNKNLALEKLGYSIIRVREKPLKTLGEKCVLHTKAKDLSKADLNKIFEHIEAITGRKTNYETHKKFRNSNLYREYLSYFPNPLPQNNLETTNPELVKEWHFDKNKPLEPKNFTRGSGQAVWWICSKGHEWRASISHRATRGDGCKKCSGRAPTIDRNFATEYPELLQYWHQTKNGNLLPEHLTPRSGKKVWWQCIEHPNHEWEVSISNITQPNRKMGYCPYCSGRKKLITQKVL